MTTAARNQNHLLVIFRTTLLSEDQFQELNGEGWVLMDGRDILPDQNYLDVSGMIELPDARGAFLRMAGGNAAALGKRQDDATALNGISRSIADLQRRRLERKTPQQKLQAIEANSTITPSIYYKSTQYAWKFESFCYLISMEP